MANVTVIVGTQWGNEGKGRIAHQISKECIACLLYTSPSPRSVLLAAAAQVTP